MRKLELVYFFLSAGRAQGFEGGDLGRMGSEWDWGALWEILKKINKNIMLEKKKRIPKKDHVQFNYSM